MIYVFYSNDPLADDLGGGAEHFRGLHRALLASGIACGGLAVAASASAQVEPSAEEAFLAEARAAMDGMMAAMGVAPSGDVDRDFAAMMIPHHQGAIDMALAELRHGRDERLRRIAQEIVVEQRQEIDVMRLALGPSRPVRADAAPPTMTPMHMHTESPR